MKRTSLALAVAASLCAAPFAARADEGGGGPKNIIHVNPIGLAFQKPIRVEYERAFASNWSFNIAPGLMLPGAGILGVGADVGIRYFIDIPGLATGSAPMGLWVGPHVGAMMVMAGPANMLMIDFGALAGYTHIFANVLSVSVGAGAGGALAPSIPGAPIDIGFQARAAIGYAF